MIAAAEEDAVMSESWYDYRRRAKITFSTRAPDDAPETKGSRCWFKPEWMEWHVTSTTISVLVSGHATRTRYMLGDVTSSVSGALRGEVLWSVEGAPRGDERPAWLLLPIDQLTSARLAAKYIDRKREEEQG